MTDLQDRLARLAPEVDSEATLAGLHDRGRRDARRRRLLVTGAAVTTVLAAVAGAVALDRADSGEDRPADPPATEGEWRALADPPFGQSFVEEGRVWTGEEVLVLGHRGSNDAGDTSWGAAYDPESDVWRTIARSPLAARSNPVVAWSGEELLVWGGDPLAFAPYQEDGAAYDPDTDTWRTIARAPIESRGLASGAWVGDELVVVGGRRVDGPPDCRGEADCVNLLPTGRYLRDGAAYDPASDTWRTIAGVSVDLGPYDETTATDDELRVFNPWRSLAYDVEADAWRELSLRRTDGETLSRAVDMHAAGGTAVAVDLPYELVDPDAADDGVLERGELRPQQDKFFVYRPELDRWEPAPRDLPQEGRSSRCSSSVTEVDDLLLVAGCTYAVVDPDTGSWTPIDAPSADGIGSADLFVSLAGEGVGGDGQAFLRIAGFSVATPPIRPGDRDDVPGFVAYRLPED